MPEYGFTVKYTPGAVDQKINYFALVDQYDAYFGYMRSKRNLKVREAVFELDDRSDRLHVHAVVSFPKFTKWADLRLPFFDIDIKDPRKYKEGIAGWKHYMYEEKPMKAGVPLEKGYFQSYVPKVYDAQNFQLLLIHCNAMSQDLLVSKMNNDIFHIHERNSFKIDLFNGGLDSLVSTDLCLDISQINKPPEEAAGGRTLLPVQCD